MHLKPPVAVHTATGGFFLNLANLYFDFFVPPVDVVFEILEVAGDFPAAGFFAADSVVVLLTAGLRAPGAVFFLAAGLAAAVLVVLFFAAGLPDAGLLVAGFFVAGFPVDGAFFAGVFPAGTLGAGFFVAGVLGAGLPAAGLLEVFAAGLADPTASSTFLVAASALDPVFVFTVGGFPAAIRSSSGSFACTVSLVGFTPVFVTREPGSFFFATVLVV